ncbi:hypothetical protein FKP32DRAFT_1579762 [Trametes sanguinea]|nr:hypothetical protein FKP32DRAFT_1579762 [Trametes sanguinea]
MGFAATFIEVKYPESKDCWCDPGKGTNRDTWCFALGGFSPLDPAYETAEETLGQNAAYAIELFARQHRSFIFSVFICGEHVRFIRWDRAGLIVSQACNYVLYPRYLCEFFWRFAHLSDAQRGFDLSVRPATKDEEKYFEQAVTQHNITQVDPANREAFDLVALLQTHHMANGVSVIHLPSQGGDRARDLLVSRPLTIPLSLTGRTTRAYWAVEYSADSPDPSPMVVLKDTWRLHEGFGNDTEGNILREMEAAEVPNIPSVVCDRDVYRNALDTWPAGRPLCMSRSSPVSCWIGN